MSDNRAPPPLVREVLTSYLDRHNLQARVQQASIINDWEKLIGVQLANVTEPDSVDRDGTLRVRVQSAAWLQELQLMSPTIIAELAKQGRTIKRIWWSLGSLGNAEDQTKGTRGEVRERRLSAETKMKQRAGQQRPTAETRG